MLYNRHSVINLRILKNMKKGEMRYEKDGFNCAKNTWVET